MQILLAATSLGLALNAQSTRPALWAVFVCSAAAAGVAGVDSPTRAALVADLVGRASLTQAMALWQLMFSLNIVVGPALAVVRFHGSAETVGLLYAARGAGALLGAAFAGWVTTIRRQGLAVLLAVAAWGCAITAFGFATALVLALVLLGLAGGADVISAVFRSTILQLEAPDALRGRLQAVQTAVAAGGPRLGDLESGAVVAAIGVANSVIAGGAVCLVGVAVLAQRMPRFVSFVVPRPTATHNALGGGDVAG